MAKKIREQFPVPSEVHITMDNYFTSVELLNGMKENLDVCATGTLKQNRIPSFPIDTENLCRGSRGDFDFR